MMRGQGSFNREHKLKSSYFRAIYISVRSANIGYDSTLFRHVFFTDGMVKLEECLICMDKVAGLNESNLMNIPG